MAPAAPADASRARRRAYRGISGGVTLICLGAVLLLNTLDILGWGVWFELLKLWPVLLISLGARWIFVNTPAHPLSLIGPALVALSTFWVVSTYRSAEAAGPPAFEGGRTIDIACPAPAQGGAARIDLVFAAGDLRFRAAPRAGQGAGQGTGPASRPGLTGRLRHEGDEPRHACDGSGDLRLRPSGDDAGFRIRLPFWFRENRWDLDLAAASTVVVDMRIAAATADVDLRDFAVGRLDADVAASRLVLQLGSPQARVTVNIEGGATDLRLVMPARTCYTVSRKRALSVLDVDDDVERFDRGRRLTSQACGSAAADDPRYEIRIELPLSSVTIETEDHQV